MFGRSTRTSKGYGILGLSIKERCRKQDPNKRGQRRDETRRDKTRQATAVDLQLEWSVRWATDCGLETKTGQGEAGGSLLRCVARHTS